MDFAATNLLRDNDGGPVMRRRACLAGCTQQIYRLAADKEVKYLVAEVERSAMGFPQLHDWHEIREDRYFDPTDPDGVPMPYDDPAAHHYMCIASTAAQAIPAGTCSAIGRRSKTRVGKSC